MLNLLLIESNLELCQTNDFILMLTACCVTEWPGGLTTATCTGHNSSHIKPLAGKLHAFQWYSQLNDNSGEICISILSAFKELSVIFFVITAKGNGNTMTV